MGGGMRLNKNIININIIVSNSNKFSPFLRKLTALCAETVRKKEKYELRRVSVNSHNNEKHCSALKKTRKSDK